jgi:hypothetical protein
LDFINLEKDIYLCFIYDPPGNSTYTHSLEENILDILEEDITKFAVVKNSLVNCNQI